MLPELTMSERDEMTIDERRKYIYKMWGRYRDASRVEKGKMLNDMEHVTGMARKSLIRILNGRLSRKKRERQRGPIYGATVQHAVAVIARGLDYPCAERLKPVLTSTAQHLMRHGQLFVDPGTEQLVNKISVTTLKRMLAKIKLPGDKIAERKPPKRKRDHLRDSYPMRKIPWDIPQPGHFEVDLVVHSGDDTSGEFIHTIQMTDVATGWSEIQAVFGRSYRVMVDGFRYMLDRLPFSVIELHPDNGSEFFNQHLLRFWNDKVTNLDLSRSRPFHKNDNRFVEENNHSLVRAYVGHGRLDTLAQLLIMRELYEDLWSYHNFFQPVMKTILKICTDDFHYRRVFDQPLTPLDRLASAEILHSDQLDALFRYRDQIDLLALHDRIESQIAKLWKLPSPKSSIPVNIYQTFIKEKTASVTLSFEPSIPVQ